MEKPKILIVDNNLEFLELAKKVTGELDCQVFTAGSGKKGLEMVESEGPFALVVSDSGWEIDAVEFLEAVKNVAPRTYRIISSIHDLSYVIGKEIAHDHLNKPISMDSFMKKIHKGLEVHKAENRKEALLASQERLAQLEAHLEKSRQLVIQNARLIQYNIERQTALDQQIKRWKNSFKFGALLDNPEEYFGKIKDKASAVQILFDQAIEGLEKSDDLAEEYAKTLDNSNAILAEMEKLAHKVYPDSKLQSLLFLYPKTYHMLQVDNQIFSSASGEKEINVAEFMENLARKLKDELIKPLDNYRVEIPKTFFIGKSVAPVFGMLFMSLYSNFMLHSAHSSRFYFDFRPVKNFGCLSCLDSSRQADNPYTQLDDVFCETIVTKILRGRVEYQSPIQRSILFPLS